MNKTIKNLAILALAITLFGAGYFLSVEETKVTQQPEDVDFSLFWEAYNRVKSNYVDPEQIDKQEMIYGAIRGMVDSLGDPHTSFFDKEESRKFFEDVSGYYEGVGMEVGIRDGDVQVISPIEGTPAKSAGIRAGDKILKIDDRSTNNMDLDKVVSLIRGERGTSVSLTLERNREIINKDIQRETIQIPSTGWEVLNENIAYLKIYYFHQDLLTEFNKIVPEIASSPTDKMILDLRGNPGGSLDSALDVANFFLESGDVIVKSQGSDGELKREYEASGRSISFDHDLVILINEGSASASEILAGALRYHKGAKIVGQDSFGKASIQRMINLSDMSNIKITVSHWVTPDGKLITDTGIVPDYKVEITPEDYENDIDPQLDKAIEIIKQ